MKAQWHVYGTAGRQRRSWQSPGQGSCFPELGFLVGAGEGNRTLMTSLEGWGSTIELRPRGGGTRLGRAEATRG
jgi:hypothetical protein